MWIVSSQKRNVNCHNVMILNLTDNQVVEIVILRLRREAWCAERSWPSLVLMWLRSREWIKLSTERPRSEKKGEPVRDRFLSNTESLEVGRGGPQGTQWREDVLSCVEYESEAWGGVGVGMCRSLESSVVQWIGSSGGGSWLGWMWGWREKSSLLRLGFGEELRNGVVTC